MGGCMRNYWVTSDTHFFHNNILGWGRDQFSSIQEMNETIIQNWNSVVKPGDNIYHLGDVFMGPSDHEQRWKLWGRLNGRKSLIIGNHDDVSYFVRCGYFRKVELWKPWKDMKVLLSHVPIHQDSLQERLKAVGGINVHGHTHLNGSPQGPYRSVCVELTNYTPVNLEDIRDANN